MPAQKEEAKSAYQATHIAPDSSTGRNSGAHFAFLEQLLARNGGGSGFIVGGSLTAADLCVWEIVDLHLRIFKEEVTAAVSGRVQFRYIVGQDSCLHESAWQRIYCCSRAPHARGDLTASYCMVL